MADQAGSRLPDDRVAAGGETVAFLFSDLEGSTGLLADVGADAYSGLLDYYTDAVEAAADDQGGEVVGREGDGLFVVFPTSVGAIRAALAVQRALADQHQVADIQVAARMGVHVGEARRHRGDDYVGLDIHRAARVGSIGHGGQVLVTEAARLLAADGLDDEVDLIAMGEHYLKGLERPEGLYQVVAPGLPERFPPLRTAETAEANLPVARTEIVGREEDVERILAALDGAGLVTVTGVGGVGKTRVALEAARRDAVRRSDGLWWCELAPVSDPEDVPAAVSTALGVRSTEGEGHAAAVVDFLGGRHALVVLDNCEHVLEGVHALVSRIVGACPRTTVLATSRTPLGVTGERVHPLAPLPVGASGDPAAGSPAVELFVARSREVRPDLSVDGAERERIVEICRRLDGLPLAIELAASRMRSLNPADLAERLDSRLDLLSDRRRDEERHQTLRTVVDWSHQLLGEAEQRLFARLSVFSGPFTLEAAEEVVADDDVSRYDVLDILTELVDHSLVVTLPTGGATRYVQLETLRAYGLEQLREAGEDDTTRRRHAEYYISLAQDADTQVRGTDEAAGVVRIDRALDNLRGVHRWALDGAETDVLMRLSAALFRYALWRVKVEVLGWAEIAGHAPGAESHPLLPTVAGMAGWAAGMRGDLDAADRWADLGLGALDDPEDPRAVPPLEVRMHTLMWQGRIDECLEVAERASALARDPYDFVPSYVPGLALTYGGRAHEALERTNKVQVAADRLGNPTMRAAVRYTRGEALLEIDPRRARDPLEEASTLAETVDNRLIAGVADVSLVSLQARHGESREALASFTAVIGRLHDRGAWTHLWTALRGLVGVLTRIGDDEDAAVLLGAVREADNAPPVYGEDAERLAAAEEELSERLGPQRLADLHTRGTAMPDHEAIDLAREAIERALTAG